MQPGELGIRDGHGNHALDNFRYEENTHRQKDPPLARPQPSPRPHVGRGTSRLSARTPLARPQPSPRPPRRRAVWPDNSLSANTREAYTRALRQFDAWRGLDPATDATLAAYLGWLFEHGRAPATAAVAVAAVTFRAKLAGTEVRGPLTDRVLAGFRRDGADRGRGQAAPLTADGFAAILASADRPRRAGCGWGNDRHRVRAGRRR